MNDKDKNENDSSGAPMPPAGYSPEQSTSESRTAANKQSADDRSDSSLKNTNTCSEGREEPVASNAPDPKTSFAPQQNAPVLNETESKEYLSIKRFSSYAIFGAFISFLFGGSLLSLISLICGIICYRKTAAFNSAHPHLSEYASTFKKRAIIAIVIPTVAFVLNLLAVVILMPIILQAAQTGDYSMLLGGGATNSVANSTWG